MGMCENERRFERKGKGRDENKRMNRGWFGGGRCLEGFQTESVKPLSSGNIFTAII